MPLLIKNWAKFQHFKDRTPPWVKLYRELLDDPDWHELDGETSKVLIGLWLIASEDETHQGMLPEVRKLAFRLRMKESQLNQALTKLSHWLIQTDITVISSGYQSDAPETERETETKKKSATPDGVSDSVWQGFTQLRKAKKAPVTDLVIHQIKKEADIAGITLDEALTECVTRGWQSFKADWYKPSAKQASGAFAGAI